MTLTDYETERESGSNLNDYDAPVNVRGSGKSWNANCKYCSKQVGGVRRRAVKHDIVEHQRTCIFRA